MTLGEHRKNNRFLICVDSDGCAIDSMEIKHRECFAPCLIDEWGLDAFREDIIRRWCEINLYSKTRGINRFRGLATVLSEISEGYVKIDGTELLCEWVATSRELSEDALERAVREMPSEVIFQKALRWSRTTNSAISALSRDSKRAFPYCREALMAAHKLCDVAVVSSANREAVTDEWDACGLLPYADTVTSQSDGSKAHIISALLEIGYAPSDVVTCGDAMGDLDAALECGVNFFPILIGRERESWERFADEGLSRLVSGEYRGEYQDALIRGFENNFL